MIGTLLGIVGLGGGSVNWVRLIVAGISALAVVTAITLAFRHYNGLIEENSRLAANNATLTANVATLEQAIADQEAAFETLQADLRLIVEVQEDTFDDFERARDRVRDLEDRLGQHELGFLASRRPGLVENIINNATDEINRCFEIATGAPLTQAEINATLNSEINSECPGIANPNYTGE